MLRDELLQLIHQAENLFPLILEDMESLARRRILVDTHSTSDCVDVVPQLGTRKMGARDVHLEHGFDQELVGFVALSGRRPLKDVAARL